jgi:hypothetical protein
LLHLDINFAAQVLGGRNFHIPVGIEHPRRDVQPAQADVLPGNAKYPAEFLELRLPAVYFLGLDRLRRSCQIETV